MGHCNRWRLAQTVVTNASEPRPHESPSSRRIGIRPGSLPGLLMQRRDEQAMVTAGIGASQRTRGEAANPVSHQPLRMVRALEASKHIAPEKIRHGEPRGPIRGGIREIHGRPLGTCSRLLKIAVTKVLRLQIEVIALGYRCTSTPCFVTGESLDNAFRRSQVAPSAVGYLQDP
jgi:hypothetical protein